MKRTAPSFVVLRLLTLSLFLWTAPVVAEDLFSSSSQPSFLAEEEFLAVEEAYQLIPSMKDNTLFLDWSIEPSYYLYRHMFKVSSNKGPVTAELTYQAGIPKYDDYYEKELEVYYQQTTLSLPTTEVGEHVIVESQACSDKGLCYPPRQQFLTIAGNTVSLTPTSGLPTPSSPSEPETSSLALILLLAMAGGAILNLMPCVFPILSVKALKLTQSGLNTHNKHLHSFAYTFGVVASFTAIAALLISLRSAGSAIGWGFQLQSPLFVGGLIYLFVLMGLSLTGLFEFGARFMNIGQSQTEGSGLLASFMTGALATVVASPCTAPFMGTALGFALTQSTAMALLVFAFLGLGMALPFLLLTWWPGLSAKMPKPGPWMERFKQFLAFPLYLSAVWLLWVLGHQTSVDTVIVVLVSLVLITLALWLSQIPARSLLMHLRRLTALSLLVSGIALPLNHYQHLQTDNATAPIWQPFSAAKLEILEREGKPIFVNLTADWCLTCLANEKLALSSDRFKQTLLDNQITYMKGDWTNYNPEITALLNKNNRNGVPLYLFYPGNGQAVIKLPQLLSENTVINTLNRVN